MYIGNGFVVIPFSHPRIAGSRLRYRDSISTCPSLRSDSSIRFSGLILNVSPAFISPLGRCASTTVLYVDMVCGVQCAVVNPFVASEAAY